MPKFSFSDKPRLRPSPRIAGCALALLASLFLAGQVQAQDIAPRTSYEKYKGWANARRPATRSPDKWDQIPTGRDGSLPEYYDVFWRALLQTEGSGTHFDNGGMPKRGMGDAKRYGNQLISIGISQARYADGSGSSLSYSPPPGAYTEARQFSPYIRNVNWDLKRYLWDPAYNAAIGYGYFSKAMKGAAGNNPCLAYAYYNGGPGGMNQYKAAKFRPVNDRVRDIGIHVASFVKNARMLAGSHRNEIEKILSTSPGCGEMMDDVDPMPPTSTESDVYVPGYCDPIAIKMLRDEYEFKQKDLDETFEPLLRTIKSPPSTASTGSSGTSGGSAGGSSGGSTSGSSGSSVWSDSMDRMSSCTSVAWPNLKITYPTMDQILRAAEREVVNRACSAAREKIADAKSPLKGSFYFNPRIGGVPSAGVSTYGETDGSP